MTLRARIHDFPRGEAGNMSAFSLFLVAMFLLVGGYAVELSSVANEEIRLQMAADTAAHAALVTRELNTEADADAEALAMAESIMPSSYYGSVLRDLDIVFGDWDATNHVFTADPDSKNAVQVTVRRTEANANPLDSYIWRIIGVDSFDLATRSTYETYIPTCFLEGFVGEDVVDLQSNNDFFNGFCIHSNNYVSINTNNTFESGTVVSMPDLSLLQLPNSGYETNLGLQAALREGSFNIRIIDRIDDIIADIDNPDSEYWRSWITNPTPLTLNKKTITAADLTAGRIYQWSCGNGGGNGTINATGGVIRDVVIQTACDVKFGAGVELNNVAVTTTSTNNASINAPAGLQVGKDDNCADDGSAQLVTMGGIDVAAQLEVYGGQLLAIGPIEFAAEADGIQGASMVSASSVSGTSNMSMGFCGDGMDHNFQAMYFRMVE